MALRDLLKFNRKTFFNPTAWFDLNQFVQQNNYIYTVLKGVFTRPESEYTESFEQAMERLGLTETDVKFGASNYRIYSIVFAVLGAVIFFYSFFILFHYKAFVGWILGMCMTGLFLAQAFKYDFWSLQMRKRKLGITFQEWSEELFGTKGK